jgi:hypothetical protein
MDGKEAFFAIRREHKKFDLAAFDEVDRLVQVSAGVNVCMFGKLDGARVAGLAKQGIAQPLFEKIRLKGLLNHNDSSFPNARRLKRLSAIQ